MRTQKLKADLYRRDIPHLKRRNVRDLFRLHHALVKDKQNRRVCSRKNPDDHLIFRRDLRRSYHFAGDALVAVPTRDRCWHVGKKGVVPSSASFVSGAELLHLDQNFALSACHSLSLTRTTEKHSPIGCVRIAEQHETFFFTFSVDRWLKRRRNVAASCELLMQNLERTLAENPSPQQAFGDRARQEGKRSATPRRYSTAF